MPIPDIATADHDLKEERLWKKTSKGDSLETAGLVNQGLLGKEVWAIAIQQITDGPMHHSCEWMTAYMYVCPFPNKSSLVVMLGADKLSFCL